jgi:hypothetical protein
MWEQKLTSANAGRHLASEHDWEATHVDIMLTFNLLPMRAQKPEQYWQAMNVDTISHLQLANTQAFKGEHAIHKQCRWGVA